MGQLFTAARQYESGEIDMEEPELQELLAIVTGVGRWAWTGPYMNTHPGGSDDAGQHEGCLELERRGLLMREIDMPGHVC